MDETKAPKPIVMPNSRDGSTYTIWDQMSRRTDLGEWEWFNSAGQWRPIDPCFHGDPDWPIRVRRKAPIVIKVQTGSNPWRAIRRGEVRDVIEDTLRTGQIETSDELLNAVWRKLTRG